MGSHDMYSSLISFAQYCSCRRYHVDDVTVNCWTAFHQMSKSQFIHLIVEGIWIFTVGTSINKAARDIMYISWWRLHTFLLDLSVQFSHSVVSDSLRPHGLQLQLQHTRLPCPSPTPGACSNSCPSNWWCHTTISSSVVPSSSCLQSFPASGSFPINQFFESGG